MKGDFRWPGFGGSSAGAADQDIAKLTVGYSTMETDQEGAYQWNKIAVKNHKEKTLTDRIIETVVYRRTRIEKFFILLIVFWLYF